MFWVHQEQFAYSISQSLLEKKKKQFKLIIGITVSSVFSCLSHWLKLPTALSIFPKTNTHRSCGLGKAEMAVGSLTHNLNNLRLRRRLALLFLFSILAWRRRPQELGKRAGLPGLLITPARYFP